jgi:hypothetical protein
VDYKISTYLAKSDGYQSKKGETGKIIAYISNLWKQTEEWANENPKFDHFELFVDYINLIFIHERYCLERAFQGIKIKGGMCKPCCVHNIVCNTMEYLFGLIFEET